MEKVLQRVKRAERSVRRRNARTRKMDTGGEAWEKTQSRIRLLAVNAKHHKDARKSWKTNWETGALAPRLDVGELVDKYGTSSIYDLHGPERQAASRRWIPIVKGDRVVATYGPDRGKIGYVMSVNEERHSVNVKDVNTREVFVPAWVLREARTQDAGAPALQQYDRDLPIEHVKLVYPLPHPETGVPRDVVIDRLEKVRLLEPKGGRANPETRTDYRAVAGSDLVIPWPELPSMKDDDVHEVDTPRITVNETTFRPYLLRPPMPTSVIDELRNKYSKFRTRHTPEFERKIEAQAERVEKRKELSKTMRTPLQELAELRARQKAAEERILTDEQLAKIGEVMAQGRLGSAQAASTQ